MYASSALDHAQMSRDFGERLQKNVSLSRYTSARVGGKADVFISVRSVGELVQTVSYLWELNAPLLMLGGGSNMLVSDAGVREVVIYNRAREVNFNQAAEPISVWAESGANLGLVARQAANRGLTGLEWAAGIPGTIGGAVVGNAGAHGGDMAGNLLVADILHRVNSSGRESVQAMNVGTQFHRESWPVEQFHYGYRTSILKQYPGDAIVLSAQLALEPGSPEFVKARTEEFVAYRKQTQPPGASMGSMFKNPPDDFAGRLIEAAGLKGKQIGKAEISPLHANFFINHGGATAREIWQLIQLARDAVQREFGVALELEIELVGEW
ncbi:MAG TPA: UDP-N-acetylmuramate dehydrogenase [Anaerolineales bacterium]